ncbi:MAG: dihydrolipoamide acetyltransferase family protein [Candidatus Nanopelagicales bacterium]|jgi:pyruvate dehydrogenase E2 component (dihydrolipoamide acetyltransferase)
MAELLLMPEVATGTTSAVLSAWPMPEGSTFKAGDILAILETDKAVVDVEAEADGIMHTHLVSAGTDVNIGVPIALTAAVGEQITDKSAALQELGYQPDPVTHPVELSDVPAATPTPASPSNSGRIFASPLARRVARERDVDLTSVVGTGPSGRIRRKDLELAALTPALSPAFSMPTIASTPIAETAQSGTSIQIPHTKLRKVIANRLTESKTTVPHFYLRASMKVDRLMAMRAELNDDSKVRISVNDLLIKAIAATHIRVPELNVIWTPDAVVQFASVDISMAVATDQGLFTPTLRSVENMSITQVALTTKDFAQRARTGSLRQNELEGGSISISNLGMFGVEDFAAIINPPQASILAVGGISTEPVVVNDQLTTGQLMRATLSVDHRPVDGAKGARWLQEFVTLIESPSKILA